jgi:hexosaminidase
MELQNPAQDNPNLPAESAIGGICLLPVPHTLTPIGGSYSLEPGRLILLDSPYPGGLFQQVCRIQRSMHSRLGFFWEASASPAIPSGKIGMTLHLSRQSELPEQGYLLSIQPEGIRAEAASESGLFYAACTLVQLVEQYGSALPCLQIQDWPDFPNRGVMLDISRDKVPTQETLFELVDLLAGWKINQLQLYTEHTFAYQQHPEVWADASPMTGQEILELDRFCRERYIQLVPNQNSFGHLHRWLEHPRYKALAEVQEGFDAPYGYHEGSFSLCPTDPASIELVDSLYAELLPHFTSSLVNVGCDETFDLGQGRSKPACDQLGSGQVYLNFLLQIYQRLNSRNKTMMFWGDIVTQHPELISQLPRDIIALEWGYEHDHPFAQNTARYAEAGIPFYVCPGTSTWASLAGRTANALANLLSAAESGRENGAIGYLITDWGDNGHWQFLPVSYAGFAAGSAFSWSLDANRGIDIADVIDRFAFQDRAGKMGRLALDLGDLYLRMGIEWVNSSPLFWILQRSLDVIEEHPKMRKVDFAAVSGSIQDILLSLESQAMHHPQASLILDEYRLTGRLMEHACQRALLAVELSCSSPNLGTAGKARLLDQDLQEIIVEYRRLWLSRSRPGGLADSAARFEKLSHEYRHLAARISSAELNM